MKDEFVTFLGQLTNARYAVVANTTLVQYEDGELIATNFDITPSGQIVTWEKSCNYLYNEFGLIQIPEPEPEI